MAVYELIHKTLRRACAAALSAALLSAPVFAGGVKNEAKTPRAGATKAELKRPKLSPTRAAAVKAAEELKVSLGELKRLHDAEAVRLAERIAALDKLFAEGIISRKELDDAKAGVDGAKHKADEVARQIVETDQTIAELMAPDPVFVPSARSIAGALRLRSYGAGAWSIASASLVDQYFRSRFGRPMPVSAFGQSAVHNRLGYDHSNAVDVPVHPDSAEGQALLAYLRQKGIPYLAFRGAIPGVATGAHIHIGRPSNRF
jgi:hypothetical protein